MTREDAKNIETVLFEYNIELSTISEEDLYVNKIVFNNRIDKIYNDFGSSCDNCIHKINGVYQEECMSCKRYYGDNFKEKK